MATGSVSISATIATVNAGSSDQADRAGRQIAVQVLTAAAQAIAAGGATSGSVVYPPGSTTVAATWSYSAPT